MVGRGAARRAATRASRAMVSRFWGRGRTEGAGTGRPKSLSPATSIANDENMSRILKYELKINQLEVEKTLDKFKFGTNELFDQRDARIVALEKKTVELEEKLEKEVELRKSSELKLVQQINAAASSAQVELIKGVMGLVAFTAMTCTGLANFTRLSSYFKKAIGTAASTGGSGSDSDKTASDAEKTKTGSDAEKTGAAASKGGDVANNDGGAATTD